MQRKQSLYADPSGSNVQLDEAVANKLPPGSKILSVIPSGKSLWAVTVKITVQLDDRTTVDFFKKGARGKTGEDMMKGTYEAEKALHSFLPDRVPRQVAWGTYSNNSDMHFYICEFVKMHDQIPSPSAWAEVVSSLHLNSMGKSPTGKFGFHVTTHLGNIPMKSLFDQDDKVHVSDTEVDTLKKVFLDKAIPRYLSPLESGGRSIKPCLIHSDLWPGKIKPMASTDELCVFDACAYWGHNEADLGICRNPRYKLGQPYIRKYLQKVPISQPEEDFDGRNAIYAMKYHALLSIMYSKDSRFRQTLKAELTSVMRMVEAPSLDEGKRSPRL